ncbi:hypothetical protein JAAARDRAFT_53717 [Jaapia argillacea MUCL 33604]|uniref:TM7S3/TM198-like domain-containing protein n=1 Tax=Jaapia argillacea MUCL 33604 TaxID=933084 RepID=A0A067QLL3_9AGAM|nr:hypothetical protein JAAARDRAFT_53717 [Jaapia argillacea MUCL 33604]
MSSTTPPSTRRGFILFLVFATCLSFAAAQSSTPSSSAPSSTSVSNVTTTSLSLVTSSVTRVLTTQSGGQNITVTTVVPSIFNVTITPTATATASASATPTPISLATKIDPAFGVLGALLIITGLPTAILGHRNRWTSFFLIGFYTLALVCFVLILQFGILKAIHPPTATIRGMFLIAAVVAGIAGGGITIFFWKATKYFLGAWGGFALGLFIQCFRNGGLIGPIGFRWIMYIVCTVIGFVLCTIPKIHYHILLVATSFVGATAFMLGVDCYTTAGLKEFYVWNLGFESLFPKFTTNHIAFPVSQTMQIEIGLMAAVALMGMAVQLRMIKILQRKLEEIRQEQRRRDEEEEARAAERFAAVDKEQSEWEKQHPTLGRHGRHDSGFSNSPLMKDNDTPTTPTSDLRSSFTLGNPNPRPRYQSGVSDLFAGPPPDEELQRAAAKQHPSVLPALDLGSDIEADVPRDFIADEAKVHNGPDAEELKRKEDLLAEIQTIRRSIDWLKGPTPTPSSSSGSRHPSFSASRELTTSDASHLRPPRQPDPRGRVQSLEMSSVFQASNAHLSDLIGRPTSVPLRDPDWDSYVQDRKLLQPPSGVSPPIATTPIAPTPRMAVPAAVTEALARRHQVESTYEQNPHDRVSSGSSGSRLSPIPAGASVSVHNKDYFSVDAPTLPPRVHQKKPSSSQVTVLPPAVTASAVTVLPPRKSQSPPAPAKPVEPRTITFEELAERHREKLRDLQAPLTQATREEAELEAAKARWERAKALEKQAVMKRQAEKAREFSEKQEKRGRSDDKHRTEPSRKPTQSRSQSADKLAAPASSSKRMSLMRVEDWQRQQQSPETSTRGQPRPNSQRRVSRPPALGGVPFPESATKPRNPAGPTSPGQEQVRRSTVYYDAPN